MPEKLKHETNLGSTGARGWIYSDKIVTSDARQILVTKVDAGCNRSLGGTPISLFFSVFSFPPSKNALSTS